jgi:hypothetical protein
MFRLQTTLIYFLIFTLISAMFAYHIVVEAYNNAYDNYQVE